jgi:hypothetical protein
LYALKLDQELVNGVPVTTTGTWIVVPNKTPSDQSSSKSLAISLGATIFNGIEDVEINPVTGDVYFTAKGANSVYMFTDNGSSVSNFKIFVGNRSYQINNGSELVIEPWGSGNDNLTFDDRGNLYVLQDGGRDYVWMVTPDHNQDNPKVQIFAKLPAGSEPCGMTFTPDFRYAFFSVQHPSSGNASETQTDAAGYVYDMAKSATIVASRKEFMGEDYVTGTSSIERKSIFSVFPNPAVEKANVRLHLDAVTSVEISISDMNGLPVAEVLSEILNAGDYTLPLQSLDSGIYLVNIQAGTESYTQKLVIQ